MKIVGQDSINRFDNLNKKKRKEIRGASIKEKEKI